jgi:hypothetical protein
MAKKKGAIGTITFFKETSKKRPLRHSKNIIKEIASVNHTEVKVDNAKNTM